MTWNNLRTPVCIALATIILAACNSLPAQQGPAGLYIWDQFDPSANGSVIRELDETVPAAGGVVTGPVLNAPEIEFGNGNFYNSSNNGELQVVSAASGMVIESILLDFGDTFNTVVTAMEFVDGVLYGGAATAGAPLAPSTFSIIDLESGLVTSIGATGIFGPLGGLAYNDGVMYAIEAGNQIPTDLYSIDLATGLATSIGSTDVQLTGLEFGADGILYALGRGENQDELFSLDPLTGNATLIGSIGNKPNGASITSASVIPEPSSAILLMTGILSTLARRRKKKRTSVEIR